MKASQTGTGKERPHTGPLLASLRLVATQCAELPNRSRQETRFKTPIKTLVRAIGLSAITTTIATGAFAACPSVDQPALAIVIDDIGYSLKKGVAMTEVPAPITLSVIPQTKHATELAELGARTGKEIMVHLPMSTENGVISDPLVLTESLTPEAFDLVVDTALTAVPGAKGVNNHQGSSLTKDRDAMVRLMRKLREYQMFFVDSRTTAETVAAEVALEMDLPTASRAVFLDNERNTSAISKSLEEVIQVAIAEGSALAIGHPYPETQQVLSLQLPWLPTNLQVVPASTLAECDLEHFIAERKSREYPVDGGTYTAMAAPSNGGE